MLVMPSFYKNLDLGVSIPLSKQSQSEADFNLERQKNLWFENGNILKHEDLKTCNLVECEDMRSVHMCVRPPPKGQPARSKGLPARPEGPPAKPKSCRMGRFECDRS